MLHCGLVVPFCDVEAGVPLVVWAGVVGVVGVVNVVGVVGVVGVVDVVGGVMVVSEEGSGLINPSTV